MVQRNTIQKVLVLEAVKKLKNHATAEEIYQLIVKEHPNISKGTVYRNLNRLAENGEIKKIQMPGDIEHFDHICSDHYHIKCTMCGRIFDVDMDYIPDLVRNIKDTHGFLFETHDIVFKGICPECRGKNK